MGVEEEPDDRHVVHLRRQHQRRAAVGALRRQLPAVLNALAHERAVAWAERKEKDASKEVMGPDSETAKAAADINNQAAYLVCRRIACC